MFTVAVWLTVAGCIAIVAMGFYAIAIDRPEHHDEAAGVCTPSRARMLTGANLDRQQLIAIQQDSEELQSQAAEIERLRAVIRQRNRTIKRLRFELEQQPGEQPQQTVTVGNRFEWLELRGQ